MANFNQAMFQANLLYGIEMTPEDFEEIGLIAWNHIGNKKTRLYKYCADVQCPDKTVELPCNADIIEAVTYGFEDPNLHNASMSAVEEYIERGKAFQSPYYISGKFARYERVGNTLYFKDNYGKVLILYKGIELDEEGLPEINEKESIAIATYCAYTQAFKKALTTGDKLALTLLQLLERKWNVYCDAARVPERLDQNIMNEVLDAKTSWNRKVYGKSLKPLM